MSGQYYDADPLCRKCAWSPDFGVTRMATIAVSPAR
jgi:hypothetical protein